MLADAHRSLGQFDQAAAALEQAAQANPRYYLALGDRLRAARQVGRGGGRLREGPRRHPRQWPRAAPAPGRGAAERARRRRRRAGDRRAERVPEGQPQGHRRPDAARAGLPAARGRRRRRARGQGRARDRAQQPAGPRAARRRLPRTLRLRRDRVAADADHPRRRHARAARGSASSCACWRNWAARSSRSASRRRRCAPSNAPVSCSRSRRRLPWRWRRPTCRPGSTRKPSAWPAMPG